MYVFYFIYIFSVHVRVCIKFIGYEVIHVGEISFEDSNNHQMRIEDYHVFKRIAQGRASIQSSWTKSKN